MNEAWAIALLGGYITAMLAVWGLVATCLWKMASGIFKINETLGRFVLREECIRDMGVQCERIERLGEKINNAESRLEGLVGKAEIWHREDL